ncbi:MAG: hypothetical protein AB7K08_13275 [Microbacteriaceae bacterium]
MSRAGRVGSVVAPPLALAGGILFDQVLRIGGEECEVYCGPGGFLLPLLLTGFVPLAWLTGVVLSAIELTRSRGRAWWGWIGVGLSLVMPIALVVMYVTTH